MISCLFRTIPVRLPGLLPYPFVSSGTWRGARPGLAVVFLLFPEYAPLQGIEGDWFHMIPERQVIFISGWVI
ncbi:hypothetical protein ASZ90_016058 [hydrocarbon metagenome]|uniref:Uncharacterized protein n=1 Tax=hydrocarbon metagenome TaxID=938273 RepID=A0A0W8F089_9ZZZZ